MVVRFILSRSDLKRLDPDSYFARKHDTLKKKYMCLMCAYIFAKEPTLQRLYRSLYVTRGWRFLTTPFITPWSIWTNIQKISGTTYGMQSHASHTKYLSAEGTAISHELFMSILSHICLAHYLVWSLFFGLVIVFVYGW